MKLPGITLAAAAGWFGTMAPAFARPTSPVDYTRRNEAFAPASPLLTGDARQPAADRVLDDAPLSVGDVSSPEAGSLNDRRAPIAVAETHPKSVAPTAPARRPEADAPTMSTLDRRLAPISTTADAVKPPLVGKYQAALSSGGAVQVGHLPALAPGAAATINRFVFRHNHPVPEPARATPAGAGGTRR